MSEFSGKCDLCDWIDILGNGDINKGFEKIKGVDIYVGYENFKIKNKLKFKSLKDLIPYFPYIQTMSSWDNSTETGLSILSEKSWVDIEEEKYGHLNMHTYYREALEREIKRWNI